MFEFPAAFDLSTVERLETTAQQNAKQHGIDRRLAFAILTKFAAELRQAAAEDPEAAEALRRLTTVNKEVRREHCKPNGRRGCAYPEAGPSIH